jgi:hypothetical protein
MNLLNILPSDILDIIFNDYWRDQYKHVIDELNQPQFLNKKIKKFLDTYFFKYNDFNTSYVHYLKLFNDEIKFIIKKPILKIICKNNNLYLQYCFCDNESMNDIDKSLKFICLFSITCSGYMRYRTFQKFKELSNVKYVPKFIGGGLL